VDDEVLHIRVGIQPPGGNAEHDVGELPAAVPIFDYFYQDASVAGGGGEVLLPRGVPPPLQTLAPYLPQNNDGGVLETPLSSRATARPRWLGP
jgi:hypothetical protein